MGKICAKSPLAIGANCWSTFSRSPPENIRLSEELRGSKDELLRIAQEFGL
jgi:hypothetical protein